MIVLQIVMIIYIIQWNAPLYLKMMEIFLIIDSTLITSMNMASYDAKCINIGIISVIIIITFK